jgi:spoIIIJ-associated protein
MNSVEADGSSIDDAIESALYMLGTTRDRVEIQILSNVTRGFFGLGGRKARIRATLRRPLDAEPTPPPAGRLEDEITSAPPAAKARTTERVDGTVVEQARQTLQTILRHLEVDAAVIVKEDDGQTVLELTGDTSGVLIGRRGQMLDALEYILNRIVARDEGSPARLVVDSQNYRTRRREALEELARRMGEQAKRKHRAVTLNPMSPHDRRIVHMILREDPTLTTKSAGKGYFRKLIIIPEGARRPARRENDSP